MIKTTKSVGYDNHYSILDEGEYIGDANWDEFCQEWMITLHNSPIGIRVKRIEDIPARIDPAYYKQIVQDVARSICGIDYEEYTDIEKLIVDILIKEGFLRKEGEYNTVELVK